jgi:molybdate transport system ATP-binding protein
MSGNTHLISIQNCRVQDIHGTHIPNVSWTMNAGEAWLVIGPNGGGKAPFLQALAGEKEFAPNEPEETKAALTDGEGAAGFSDAGAVPLYSSIFTGSAEIVSLERAAALIEEERNLDESEIMDHPDEGRSGRRFICEVLGGPDALHRCEPLPSIGEKLETLPEVKLCGVEKILDRGLKYMSTGEIRRTLLCRALLSGKKLLILSDPFAGLDAASRTILLEFFQTVVGRQLNAGERSDTTRIILGMERYTEIPETITHVLELTGNIVSFCGKKTDYEKIIKEREQKSASTRMADKAAFIGELNAISKETEILINEKPAGEKTLIQMNNVNVGWEDHQVLKNLNWNVMPGEHWLIRGPNGSGKTTLLELITGDNMQVFKNDVWLFGRKRGTGETLWEIKAKLGIVSYRLHVEYRMVGGTDLEAVIISGFHDSIGLYEQKTDVEIATAARWLKLAGFEGREYETFSSLSYGEQRAILIIRAAVKQPPVLILDEPCHGLDDQYRQKILDLLETVAQTGTTTLLHVTHDPTEVLPCEKHILELYPGESVMYKISTV